MGTMKDADKVITGVDIVECYRGFAVQVHNVDVTLNKCPLDYLTK